MNKIALKKSDIENAKKKIESGACKYTQVMYKELYALLGDEYKDRITDMTNDVRKEMIQSYDIQLLIQEGIKHGAFEVC